MYTTEEIVRAVFKAYETADSEALHALLADDFEYSAPPDPYLRRDAYIERCWPFHKNEPCYTFKHFFVKQDEAFVMYHCTHKAGPTIRNAEHLTVRAGQLASVTVFVGPPVDSGVSTSNAFVAHRADA